MVARAEYQKAAAALAELELARRRPHAPHTVAVLDIRYLLLRVAKYRWRYGLTNNGDGHVPGVAACRHHIPILAIRRDYFLDEVAVVEVWLELVDHVCLLVDLTIRSGAGVVVIDSVAFRFGKAPLAVRLEQREAKYLGRSPLLV